MIPRSCKRLSPHRVLVSVDLEDSIVAVGWSSSGGDPKILVAETNLEFWSVSQLSPGGSTGPGP